MRYLVIVKATVESEAEVMPAKNGLEARGVDHVFWLTPFNAAESDVWYAGTSPQGLFCSEDGGVTGALFSIINETRNTDAGSGPCKTGRPTGLSCTRSSSIRATNGWSGCCRWMARTSGRVPAPAAGRRGTPRAMPVFPGSWRWRIA